ncbi:polyprenyl synthetase family protein, partial [bacterium]|nr:polyprenyl synthetase family protein [bacterium]
SLKSAVDDALVGQPIALKDMFYYHLGWDRPQESSPKSGKRVRPLLLMFCLITNGGDINIGLPMAAAVELIHNFSLIHDDIEDASPKRRGRLALWKKCGLAQAINTGDAMFAAGLKTAFLASRKIEQATADKVFEFFSNTCLMLTKGQYLDLAFEQSTQVMVDEYWEMISGKTAALIGCATFCGATLAGCSIQKSESFFELGKTIGLAFQVYDDYLGIWGSENVTGKPVNSDLMEKKQSYPIILGLQNSQRFNEKWKGKVISKHDALYLSEVLREDGVKDLTLNKAEKLTREAYDIIGQLEITNESRHLLREFSEMLLMRQH